MLYFILRLQAKQTEQPKQAKQTIEAEQVVQAKQASKVSNSSKLSTPSMLNKQSNDASKAKQIKANQLANSVSAGWRWSAQYKRMRSLVGWKRNVFSKSWIRVASCASQ